MPTDEQRQTACLQIARQLAGSGGYADYEAIATALAPVYGEAPEWFREHGMLDELDKACRRARHGSREPRGGAAGYGGEIGQAALELPVKVTPATKRVVMGAVNLATV